jgi:hypothetical protein
MRCLGELSADEVCEDAHVLQEQGISAWLGPVSSVILYVRDVRHLAVRGIKAWQGSGEDGQMIQPTYN